MMPPAIDAQIRGQVVKEWLSGNNRDEIAANNKIGAGTVSNIINEWKKGIDSIGFLEERRDYI
jgi:transposase